jgi:hypothetical protein
MKKEFDDDHVGGRWRWWLVAAVMAVVGTGCTSPTPMCVPEGGVVCCSPGDTQLCTADGGVDGLKACGMSGFWSDCVAFMDAGPQDHQVVMDTGGLPDFGRVDH